VASDYDVAWQGWCLRVPEECAPVRLEGDYATGSIVLADMDRKRLELRWQTSRRAIDLRTAMCREVGALAAGEARPTNKANLEQSLLYLEPQPPGRDVCIGYSPVSRRVLTIVYHVRSRDRALEQQILPTLHDQSPDEPHIWSAFSLRCTIPAGLLLRSRRLNAGDLALTFAKPGRLLGVREVAVAHLALRRMPLADWVANQQKIRARHYRATGDSQPFTFRGSEGVVGRSLRRRRYFLLRSLPNALYTCAVHDAVRDRVIIVEAHSQALMLETATTVGKAATEELLICHS